MIVEELSFSLYIEYCLANGDTLEIPYEKLSQEALQGALEEFVLRENAESGHSETTTAEKVAQVRRLLETGKAKIVFDTDTNTHAIINCD